MPHERVYLLADMHLKPNDEADAERLARFLAHIEGKADTLILLGDAFNFWLERKSRFIGEYSAVLNLFKAASEKGLLIHHVSGNRDFIVGEGLGFDPLTRYPGFIQYGRNCFTVSRLVDYGIEVHGPRYRFHQTGKTIACLHGDALCRGDVPFMVLRWMLQGPMGRTFFKYAPWALLKRIVARQQARKRIRNAGRKRPASLLSHNAVRHEMAMGADLLVCGHIHSAHERTVTVADRECTLAVLPAWLDGAYGVIENGEVRTERFESGSL